MLLTHLNKVAEIDRRIAGMHRDLADLYQERLKLMGQEYSVPDDTADISEKSDIHKDAERWYHLVVQAWEAYGLQLPAYSGVESKFMKAYKILGHLESAYPEIAAQMEIVAIPPSRLMSFPDSTLRCLQAATDLPDFVNISVSSKKDTSWRFLLVYGGQDSLYGGSAKRIIKEKRYVMAGYDMRALGPREYMAMTLQKDELLDSVTWTVFMKSYKGKAEVSYAGYRQGRYRFDVEDADNILEDDGFRPAIEL